MIRRCVCELTFRLDQIVMGRWTIARDLADISVHLKKISARELIFEINIYYYTITFLIVTLK